MINILFVCHGNICRSPMAEYILQDMVTKQGMQHLFHIASAATSTEEIGNDVHYGTKQILKEHGIACPPRTAKQMNKRDYDQYNYLIGMDSRNIQNMHRIVGADPQHKIIQCLDFTNQPGDIADPWYTGNFKKTYEQISAGCTALLQHLTSQT